MQTCPVIDASASARGVAYQNRDSGCFQQLRLGFTIQFFNVLVMMIISVSDNSQ
jgi:hypothetical protein